MKITKTITVILVVLVLAVGGLFARRIFFGSYLSPADQSLVQSHKDLYKANQLFIQGDFTLAGKQIKFDMYLDKQNKTFYFKQYSGDDLQEGYISKDNISLDFSGGVWRKQPYSSHQSVEVILKTLIARNLLETLTMVDRNNLSFNTINKEVEIKSQSLFNNLYMMMDGSYYGENEAIEESTIKITQNLTGGLKEIVVTTSLTPRPAFSTNPLSDPITGKLTISRINEVQTVDLPEYETSTKFDYSVPTMEAQ